MVVFLFTKKFPYGKQETYIEDELYYLKRYFDKVIIIPHDEYTFLDSEFQSRKNINDIEIFKINAFIQKLSFWEKIKREIVSLRILITEIVHSRERFQHIKNFFNLFGQLRHLYNNALALRRFIEQRNYEASKIIFYNYWLHRGSIICGIYNRYFSKDKKIKTVARAHSIDLFHKDWNEMIKLEHYLFLPFEYFKIRTSDKIFSISQKGLRHLGNNFPEFKDKFHLSRLGIHSPSAYNPVGVHNAHKVIVSCSHIDSNKRIYIIPQIISKLKSDVVWIHIGTGGEKYLQLLKNNIIEHKVEKKCKLLGFMSRSDVINFYLNNHVDLFINLSKVEGIPVSIMEALSFGIPVLATNAGSNNEIVDDSCGFLVPVDFDINEVAKIIDNFFNNPELIEMKRKGAFKKYQNEYNAEKNYTEFVKKLLF